MGEESNIVIKKLNQAKEMLDISEKMQVLADKLLKNAREEDDLFGEAVALYYLALFQYRKGNAHKALELALKSNTISTQKCYVEYMLHTCNLIGILYNLMYEHYMGLSYFLKGYHIVLSRKDNDQISRYLNNIGDVFLSIASYKEAIHYFTEAKEVRERLADYTDHFYTVIMLNLIESHLLIGNNEEVSNLIRQMNNYMSEEEYHVLRIVMLTDEVALLEQKGSLVEAKSRMMFLLKEAREYPDDTHVFHCLIRVCHLAYRFANQEVGVQYIEVLRHVVQRIGDINFDLWFQEILVEYYRASGNSIAKDKAMTAYYMLNRQCADIRRKGHELNLINKIALEQVMKEQELEVFEQTERLRLAEQDALTGLYHKDAIESKIIDDLEMDAPGEGCALFLINLSWSKESEESNACESMIGEVILTTAARHIKESFRNTDLVGRLGRDEFLVYVRDVGIESTEKRNLLNMRLKSLTEKIQGISLDELEEDIWIHVGATFDKDKSKPLQTMYKNAGKALEYIKSIKDGGFIFYEDL